MLPLGAGLLVFCYHLPTVWIVGIDKHAPSTHINHRLNGKHHAGHQQHARAAIAVVVDLGLLVELQANAVTCQVLHDAIAIFLAMLFDGMTDVAHKAPRLGGLHAYLQTLLGHTHQLLILGCRLANDKHT